MKNTYKISIKIIKIKKGRKFFLHKHQMLVLSSIIGSPAAKGIQGLTTRSSHKVRAPVEQRLGEKGMPRHPSYNRLDWKMAFAFFYLAEAHLVRASTSRLCLAERIRFEPREKRIGLHTFNICFCLFKNFLYKLKKVFKFFSLSAQFQDKFLK